MAKPKTKVAKIVIDLNDERLELSPKQAKELRDILCELYGSTETIVEKHYHDRYWPYQTWTIPNYSTCIDAISATTATWDIDEIATSGTVYLAAA